MEPRTILIAVDAGSRTLDAVRLGELLAKVSGAPVTLATVFPDVPFDGADEAQLREQARTTLLELGQTMEGVDVRDARVLEGLSPARALQRISEDEEAGLIVIGSSHRGTIGRIVPGSVAERLLHGAATPVAVAPAGYGEEPGHDLRTIGVAFDGSEESEHALRGAAALARRAKAKLRLVSVHQRIAFGALPAAALVSTESVNDAIETEMRQRLDETVAAQSDELEVEGFFMTGDAAETLAAQSEELDLLITGSRGYGPIGAVLLGGTTHRLLSAARCPLLITPRGATFELG